MPESSIVIFADGPNQNRYRDLGIDKESLNIFACADAHEIMERLKANVVLIDCGVHARKGIKLLKEIKARHPQVPVVFLTDASSEELAIAAFRSGAREYFANPVNRLVLRKTIKTLVNIRKKMSEVRMALSPVPDDDLKMIPGFEVRDMPPRLQEILSYIEENLADQISLASLAEHLRMSKYHFSRYFRKYIGMSPIKYLNLARVQRAKGLLRRDDLTIREIAYRVGYDDLGALLRNFKKIEGRTPSDFRRRPGGDHCGAM